MNTNDTAPCLAQQPHATPVRHGGYMDWTVERGRRMLWQFWYADGSSNVTNDPKLGLRLTERMMKAGLIMPRFGDAIRALARREQINARTNSNA